MWERAFYGNTTKDWVISLAVIVGAVLLNKLIQLLNKKVFQKWASKTNNKYDDILLCSLEKPVLWGIMLIAIWIAIGRLTFPSRLHDLVKQAYQILIVLNITWFVARLLSTLLEESTKRTPGDRRTKRRIDKKFFPLINRSMLILIWVIGGIMALSNAGISVGALLGTLGIGGVAIALASQDTIKNLLGGITILTDKAFNIGDTVNINGTEGTVEDIGLRSTRIRTYDKRLVTIPNYKVTDAPIMNISKEPKRRVLVNIGLTYDTTPGKMKEAIKILLSMPEKVKELDSSDISANFSNFGDSALIITYIYNIRKSADIGGTTSAVNFEILSQFNNADIDFAFPSQTIYIEKDEDEEETVSTDTSENSVNKPNLNH